LADDSQPLQICIQAAFSHFAADETGSYDGQPAEEVEVALSQKKALMQLCLQPRTNLELLIWPKRTYPQAQLQQRYRNLLVWMEEMVSAHNIEFLCAEYSGPNRFIVQNHFCLEGYKQHPTTGYDLTIVKYRKAAIDASLKDFMKAYAKAQGEGQTKQTTIDYIRELHSRTRLGPAEGSSLK